MGNFDLFSLLRDYIGIECAIIMTAMKIQSCTAKLLKYPALATLAAMAGSAIASDTPAQQTEQQTAAEPTPQQEPPSPPQKPEEEEIPVPQYYLGEIEPERE